MLDISLDNKFAIEGALFIENEVDISPSFTVNYGLRWSYFNYTGEGLAYEFGEPTEVGLRRPFTEATFFDQWESIETYNNFEPRLSMKYQLSDDKSIKASYNRTVQYIHLISNTTASTPVDVWQPSTNNLEPQRADQVALGYFQNFKDNSYEFSAEIYYKRFIDLLDYIDGSDILLNELL